MDTRAGWAGHAGRDTHWHADHVGAMGCCTRPALGSRPALRTPRPLPAATRAAAKPSTSTSRSAPTPSMRRSTMGRSFGSATPTGRSFAPPGTPPATCRCGSPRSGCWRSAMRSRTTTSAGSTWPWMGPTRPPPPSPPCTGWQTSPRGCCCPPTGRSLPTPGQRSPPPWVAPSAWSTTRPGRCGTAPGGSSPSP